jgi:ABC-type antimicrobial peptide transport system permease subunit
MHEHMLNANREQGDKMLKHYFLIILRNFLRFKNTFLINLIGLSTGLACVLFIYLWVNNELNFDKFNEEDARLYQVMANHNNADRIITMESTPDLLAETMAEELPEVEYAAAVFSMQLISNPVLSLKDKNIKAAGRFAGKDYFKIFSYKLIQGNKNHVLSDKKSIVVSRQLALKLFNTTENIVGKTLEWQWVGINEPVVISGVFEGTPPNSSLQFDFIISIEAWKDFSNKMGRSINWDNHAPSAYLVLRKGTDIEQFNKKIAGFIKSKYTDSRVTLFTRKYSDGYLYGKYENGKLAGGRIEYVRIFSIIAIFILVIACINFMNLSTAKAGSRLKEIGIKKSIGAGRKSLILQFIGESLVMTLLSLAMAFILVELFLPQFNNITGKQLFLHFNFNFILVLFIIALFTGLLSGSYPALYLSRFNPVNIMKGKSGNSTWELLARKGLVIFQFCISVIFIVSVLVVYRQVEFIQTKNPGYEKDNIIYFDKEGKASANYETFLAELKKVNGVVNASIIGSTVVGHQNSTAGIGWEGKNPGDVIYFEEVCVGYNMLETLGIEMKEGRTFSREFGAENSKIIFNEAAINVMGLKDPLGKKVFHWSGEKEIVGVVKNFHFESLHEVVKPLLFRIEPLYTTKFMAKLKEGKEKEAIERLQRFYKEYNAGYSFDFKFLDEDYQAQYASEKRVETLSKYFAGLAIIISCLGLFGLASFTAEKKTKEIGIRKVLGANTKGIVILLSKDFLYLILISLVIASPLAWYITNNWLQDFAYRIDLTWWMFALAGGIALAIALATVSFQAIKAATANPVESLRYE